MTAEPLHSEHLHFVTGRLAEPALRRVVARLAASLEFAYSLEVLPISVAALMTPAWIARHAHPPAATTRVIIPGYCGGDLAPISAATGRAVERGPKDLRRLPEYFGQSSQPLDDYGTHDIEIIAEINHAPRRQPAEIRALAEEYGRQGADIIDVGCEPGEPWTGVADCVKALRDDGYRVSIDSLQPAEIAPAVRAGAELVLSVNRSNRQAAADWGCPVVVIPDEVSTLEGFDETVEFLHSRGVSLRLDPILEPIGCGFAASLGRYLEVRRRYAGAEMLMGIGNLTELTDADSAGINVLLLGFCQELGIRSVLTTAVIHWARTSVRECDLARRLVHFACRQGRPPKHLEPGLVTLRDAEVWQASDDELAALAARIRDPNYRLFLADGQLHLLSAGLHLQDADPFALLSALLARKPKNLDASHAFYLGYELAKAVTARTLGKQYEQDRALDWGYLTVPEVPHPRRSRRTPEA